LNKIDFNIALISPNKDYIFGTNQYGQNMFYLILIGSYNTLKLAFITTIIYVTIGVFIGIIGTMLNINYADKIASMLIGILIIKVSVQKYDDFARYS
jgi:ABC-type dipeptide/oligopeptide/nickel transport system permease subunit